MSAPLRRDTLQNDVYLYVEDVKGEYIRKCCIVVKCMNDDCKVRNGKGKLNADISLFLSKNTKRAARHVSIRRTNHYQQNINHMLRGGIWDLIHVYMERKLAIEVLLHHHPS